MDIPEEHQMKLKASRKMLFFSILTKVGIQWVFYYKIQQLTAQASETQAHKDFGWRLQTTDS